MYCVDREKYTSRSPYTDAPQGIGFGVTISAPHMVLNDQHNIIMLSISFINKQIFFLACICIRVARRQIKKWK